MNSVLYKEVVGQISKLISSRGFDIRDYMFIKKGYNVVEIHNSLEKVSTVDTSKFILDDVIKQVDEWRQYKTEILNEALKDGVKKHLILYAYPIKGLVHNPYRDDSSGE